MNVDNEVFRKMSLGEEILQSSHFLRIRQLLQSEEWLLSVVQQDPETVSILKQLEG